jgi:hypothetical protein
MNKSTSFNLYLFSGQNSRNYLILFVLWPFIAFITALANYSQKEARNIVYMFLVYFGLTFFAVPGMDSYAYVRSFLFNASLPISQFFEIVGGLYTSDTSVDIIEPLISFIISRFTSNYGFLFASYAALFGYFYLKSIDLLYDRYHEKPGLNTMIFMLFFISVISIYNINGFRMWTAAWIFFYGSYHVVLYRKKKFFLLTLAACLIHWSFLSANAVLFLYFIIGNCNFIYLPLAFVSFLIPNLIAPLFNSISMRMGGSIQNRYSGYSNEEYILSVNEGYQQTKWFVTLSKDLIFYYLIVAVAFIYLINKDMMKEKAEKNLFSFLLLFLSFVNFGKSIPSFGNRFQIVFILFATLYGFLYFLKIPGDKINLLTIIGLFPMALYVAVEFRIGSEVINSWIFLPGFGMPLLVPGISMAEILFY